MALRKNQRWLTAWEKKYFTDAVLKLVAPHGIVDEG
jgi:hypothetical protein